MLLLYLSESRVFSRQAKAIQIRAMCAAFVRLGHSVHLTGIAEPRGISDDDVGFRNSGVALHLSYWPTQALRHLALCIQAQMLVRRLCPNLVFTRSALLARAVTRFNVPIMLELHALPETGSKSDSAMRHVLHNKNLVQVVCISHSLADDFARAYGPLRTDLPISVAHDGADAGPEPAPRLERRQQLVVGYFGHLYPGKGMELIAAVAPRVPDVRFDVYGGTEVDLARWRAQPLVPNIFLRGYRPHHRVRPLMEACDLLIAPYGRKVSHVGSGDIGRWMSPLKLFEYMSAGRAIVASDLPVIREVLTDYDNALLCDPDGPASWQAALLQLARDGALMDRLGSAGRRLLLEKYTWDARATCILSRFHISPTQQVAVEKGAATGVENPLA
jgi:glycosyltransferase involved in cell wall biosynthesis